jgi:AAA domain
MAEMTELPKADVAVGGDTACRAFTIGQPLAAPLLYRQCDPAELPFAVCTELEEASGLIGQERAVEAVQFAMRMRRKGYNVYALGPSGSGRHSAVEGLLLGKAATEQTPPDWCYVNNFADPLFYADKRSGLPAYCMTKCAKSRRRQ